MDRDAPLGIELASVPLLERRELVMLSLTRTADDGECLELANWSVAEPSDDGVPQMAKPKYPVLLSLGDLPALARLVELALPGAVLDEEGWALLARGGELICTLVEAPTGERMVTVGWHDGETVAFLPVELAAKLPAMLAEAEEALAARRSGGLH